MHVCAGRVCWARFGALRLKPSYYAGFIRPSGRKDPDWALSVLVLKRPDIISSYKTELT
jgi:hypothetical protein